MADSVQDKQRSNRRRVLSGIVKSDKMDKTIVVEVSQKVRHKIYGKVIKRFTKVKAHDEKNQAKVGDRVYVRESRPMSKEKRWALVQVMADSSTQEKSS